MLVEYKQALSYVIGVGKKVITVKIWCPVKLKKVKVIVVTHYFETVNQFPDTQYAKFNVSANRNCT